MAAILRLGAADFAAIAEPDDVVLAVEHALGQDRQSRRRQIEAAAAAAVRNAEQHMESVFTEGADRDVARVFDRHGDPGQPHAVRDLRPDRG